MIATGDTLVDTQAEERGKCLGGLSLGVVVGGRAFCIALHRALGFGGRERVTRNVDVGSFGGGRGIAG